MVMIDIANECKRWAVEMTGLRRGNVELPSRDSAGMLVSGGIGTVEVGILASHEATLLVV